jgi:type III secretion protein J
MSNILGSLLFARLRTVAAVLLCLCILGCDTEQAELTKVDSEKEANRILVELEAHGIHNVQKVEVSEQRKTIFTINVRPQDLTAARTILVQADLPREKHGGLAGMADSSSLIPTKSEERAKMMHALSGELEETFETYDRVVSARVHIVLPEKDPLARDATTKPTASAMVLIKYTPLPADSSTAVATTADAAPTNYNDAPVKTEEVQQMVARSIEGLTPQSVFVSFTKATSRPIELAAATTAAGSTTAPADGATASTPADKKLMMQLFGAVAVFGLISIFLTALLVKEKRKQRVAATTP